MRLNNIERVLIINLGGIGDLLLSTPALKALKSAYPRASIDILLVNRAAAFMESYGLFSSIHSFPAGNLAALLHLLFMLRRNHYDLAINMRTMVSGLSALKMRLIFAAVNPKISAGRDTEGMGKFFDISIPENYPGGHAEYAYDIDLVNALGIDVNDREISLPLSERDTAYAAGLLQQLTDGDFIIGMNPGGNPQRRWPAEKFTELAKLLLQDPAVRIVLTGSPQEADLCASIAASCGSGRCVDCSSMTSVNQLAALIKRCALFITNDTGPMHLATAVGTPGVYIFGPGHRNRYRPFRSPERYAVVYRDLPCSPCDKEVCPSMGCLSIPVVEVYAAAVRLRRSIYDR